MFDRSRHRSTFLFPPPSLSLSSPLVPRYASLVLSAFSLARNKCIFHSASFCPPRRLTSRAYANRHGANLIDRITDRVAAVRKDARRVRTRCVRRTTTRGRMRVLLGFPEQRARAPGIAPTVRINYSQVGNSRSLSTSLRCITNVNLRAGSIHDDARSPTIDSPYRAAVSHGPITPCDLSSRRRTRLGVVN